MLRNRTIALLFTLLGVMLGTSPAFAWYDKDWSYRKVLTIDSKAADAETGLKHYPLLVRLDASQFNFQDAQKAGQDIRFVDSDDKTALAYQIESYDAALGLAMIWVDVPDLEASSQHQIWMYYGNPKATPVATSNGVFDTAYHGVWHFPSTGPAQDASAFHNTLSDVRSAAAAAIGAGASFDGTNAVTIPGGPALAINPASGFTLSLWVEEKTPSANAVLYSRRDGASFLVLGLKNGTPYLEVGSQHVDASVAAGSDWTHLAVVGDATKTLLYVDGKLAGTINAAVPAMAGTATLGGDSQPGSNFTGTIDELRLSNIARTPSQLAADYAAQRAGAGLVAFGADEKASGVGFGYFGIIFSNITPDAWVVIAILLIMAVLSWIVMYTKWGYVSQSARANRAFLAAYRHENGDLAALDATLNAPGAKRGIIGRAPLYRLFATGMNELHARGDLRGRALTEETVESIRASLDGQQVEENQALDKNMVLLTISIAGGPFIGLLGTVLGVMITFAAIAAAGDVNVNAIAPGIAAALLATVTGLFVAIPALFGYNYISTLNADVSAKMQVFADQFVTRLAEVQRNAAMPHAAE